MTVNLCFIVTQSNTDFGQVCADRRPLWPTGMDVQNAFYYQIHSKIEIEIFGMGKIQNGIESEQTMKGIIFILDARWIT